MRPTNEISDPVWQDIWDRDDEIARLRDEISLGREISRLEAPFEISLALQFAESVRLLRSFGGTPTWEWQTKVNDFLASMKGLV